ncbi:hypothetical protein HFO56_33770 [Rhizobium laguerreae]|uniref:hypothetical protein n=1 Tax=Rhizobium laguerreae TaxID=1076926 RepID=UPI001C923F52|nr:hypothetical protein [Rhizobium laguerreae]MBY3157296.1 hypothetical protein [Rhizobium laguerreae]
MSAENKIRGLASRHEVSAEPPDLSAPENRWIAKLSAPPNELSEPDWLLINLHRLMHVSEVEYERLYGRLIAEREG